MIVGGGVVGAAAAYHLAVAHGWRDIVVIDQGPLPYNVGSTSHAPGGVVAAAHSQTLSRMGGYSAGLYRQLDSADAKHHATTHNGGLELCRTPERFEDMKRLHGRTKAYGMPTRLLTPSETVAMLPWIDESMIVGALFMEESLLAKGYHLVADFLRRAAAHGVAIHEQTGLVDIEVANGAVAAVTTNNPSLGRIECEHVLLAANVWSPAISEKLGVHIPLMPFEHQYAITHPLQAWAEFAGSDPDVEVRYPLVRDLDTAMYFRAHWDSLGIGTYAHRARPVYPERMGMSALREFTPADFEPSYKHAQELVPLLRDVDADFSTAFNGIFAFSVDGMPIIGPSNVVRGLWSANAAWLTHAAGVAKSVAEWMADGETEWDMRECHLHRFPEFATTRQYVDRVTVTGYSEIYDIRHPSRPPTDPRNVRLSPFHGAHVEADVSFVPFAGLELPNWFESNAGLVERYADRIPGREGWAAEYWSPIQGAEHLHARDHAGLWDLTGLSIIEVSGPEALAEVQRLCSNDVDVDPGKVVYTCWLTPKGGVRRDLAVARRADDCFWMFVGEGTLPMDLAWVRQHVESGATVIDRSPAYSGLGIFGPKAVSILEEATDVDLSQRSFPYFTAKTIEIAMTPVFAMRISYMGESGFELHIPIDSSMPVHDEIVRCGRSHDMIRAGLGAMDSMRLEKGYRLWGADVHTDYNPYEAGLGWTVKLAKGDFVGREAAAAASERPLRRKLVPLRIDDPAAVVRGYEPVLAGGDVVGYVTSGNFGYNVGHYISYAYVGAEYAEPATELTVEYFDVPYSATVAAEPLFDPTNERMRS